MKKVNKSHGTKNVRLELTNNDPSKRAGSNNLTITVASNDWRITDQRVSMTIRDAQALKSFLNQNLS